MAVVPIPADSVLPKAAVPNPAAQAGSQSGNAFASALQRAKGADAKTPGTGADGQPIVKRPELTGENTGPNRGGTKKDQNSTKGQSSPLATMTGTGMALVTAPVIPVIFPFIVASPAVVSAAVANAPIPIPTLPAASEGASQTASSTAAAGAALPQVTDVTATALPQSSAVAIDTARASEGQAVSPQQTVSAPSPPSPSTVTQDAGPRNNSMPFPDDLLLNPSGSANGLENSNKEAQLPNNGIEHQRKTPADASLASAPDLEVVGAHATAASMELPAAATSAPNTPAPGASVQSGQTPGSASQASSTQNSPTTLADPAGAAKDPNADLVAIIKGPAAESVARNSPAGGADNSSLHGVQPTSPTPGQPVREPVQPTPRVTALLPQASTAPASPGGQNLSPSSPTSAGTKTTERFPVEPAKGSADARTSSDQGHAAPKTASGASKASDNNPPAATASPNPPASAAQTPQVKPANEIPAGTGSLGAGSVLQAAAPASQSAASSNLATPAKPQAPPPASSSETPQPSAGLVQSAHFVDNASQSEMRIDLRTQAFGSVEVHTVVRGGQVGLDVGSETGDLRGFLSAEVPGLQTALHRQDLHFDNIRFLGQGAGIGAGLSGQSDAQSRSFQPGHHRPQGAAGFHGGRQNSGEPEIPLESPVGLNVHA